MNSGALRAMCSTVEDLGQVGGREEHGVEVEGGESGGNIPMFSDVQSLVQREGCAVAICDTQCAIENGWMFLLRRCA